MGYSDPFIQEKTWQIHPLNTADLVLTQAEVPA